MLRRAEPGDADFVHALWTAPEIERFIEEPGEGEIAARAQDGTLFIWDSAEGPAGFAAVTEWVPRVWSVAALAVAVPGRGTGRALATAVLDHLFHDRGAHRVGLDATVDNAAALALYASLGFRREGTWRECWLRADGAWIDCAFLGLLEQEWRRKP